ncbi:hypothetical protein BDW22DRAFT_464935 [Trametopsis cervina]|nr:hypothetical protein BDW22DRAFT_464935 [Trametopsis cervina]
MLPRVEQRKRLRFLSKLAFMLNICLLATIRPEPAVRIAVLMREVISLLERNAQSFSHCAGVAATTSHTASAGTALDCSPCNALRCRAASR